MLEPLVLADLLAGGWRDLPFAPFRPGVLIHRLYGDGTGPSAAILRYAPGGSVPPARRVQSRASRKGRRLPSSATGNRKTNCASTA